MSGPGSGPVVFGEAATSKFTPGLPQRRRRRRLGRHRRSEAQDRQDRAELQYQSVGPNYIDGAPDRYYGNAPQLFSFWKANVLPGFYGFGNSLTINQQFDDCVRSDGGRLAEDRRESQPDVRVPAVQPAGQNGRDHFQAFTPNTQGITLGLNAPVRIGDMSFTTNTQYQNLQELRPTPKAR